MSKYTNNLTAEQVIKYIASDYVELSHDKAAWQRDQYIKMCREWLKHQESKQQQPSNLNGSDKDVIEAILAMVEAAIEENRRTFYHLSETGELGPALVSRGALKQSEHFLENIQTHFGIK